MKLLFTVSLMVTLVAGFSSCKVINPEAPSIQTVDIPASPQPISEIDIPVRMDLTDFFRQAESAVPTEYTGSDNPCEGVRYSYLFQRSPFNIAGSGQTLNLSFEGKYKFDGTYCAKCIWGNCVVPKVGFSCGVGEPLKGVSIAYSSNILIQPDYRLKTTTQLATLTPLDRCKITVLNIDVTDKLINGIRGPLSNLGSKVDEKVAAVDLRPKVQELWGRISEQLTVGEFGFLNIHPNALRLSTLNMNNSTVDFSFGLSGKPVISSANSSSHSTPVPDLTTYAPANGFNVYLDLSLGYDSITSHLNRQLVNRTIKVANNDFKIVRTKLYGIGNSRVVMAVDFKGTRKGSVFLVGTPTFNNITKQFSIPDLAFDIKTKNVILKVAKWMFNSKITNELRRVAVFNLTGFLADGKAKLQKEMNKDLGHGIVMQGNINDLNLQDIYPSSNTLLLRTLINGQMSISIRGNNTAAINSIKTQ